MIGRGRSPGPLAAHFALTFAVSWGGILAVFAGFGFGHAALQPLETGLMFVLMLLGPSIGGLILTAKPTDRTGIGQLKSQFLSWRAGIRWYALALLTMPLLLLAVLLPLGVLADPAFFPGFRWQLLAIGLRRQLRGDREDRFHDAAPPLGP